MKLSYEIWSSPPHYSGATDLEYSDIRGQRFRPIDEWAKILGDIGYDGISIYYDFIQWHQYNGTYDDVKKRLKDEGVRIPDQFFGICTSGYVTSERLKDLFLRLSDGVTEIMVHPGIHEIDEKLDKEYIEKNRLLTNYRKKEYEILLNIKKINSIFK